MRKTSLSGQHRRERLFVLFALLAAVGCAGAAFWFAVPLQDGPEPLPDTTGLSAYYVVDLNTADAAALCTLPGVGQSRAQAILDYRARYGAFAQVEDVLAIPGITPELVASWGEQATVS